MRLILVFSISDYLRIAEGPQLRPSFRRSSILRKKRRRYSLVYRRPGCTKFLPKEWTNNSRKRVGMLCVVVIYLVYLCNIFFFFIPFIFLALLSCSLPSMSSNSDPGSHIGPSFPLPTTSRAFTFIATSQNFLHSLTGVELYLPTLLGALSS